MSYSPRSSMPVNVFDWLCAKLAHLEPVLRPGRGGNPGLPVCARLDAYWLVAGDGLSYRKVANIVDISKSAVGDSVALLPEQIAEIGICQPDGTFITSLAELELRCAEMQQTGEPVCIDGAGVRTQRPNPVAREASASLSPRLDWINQYQLWDEHHHQHGVHAIEVSTTWGDLLWVDGGWPGRCHELVVAELSGVADVLAKSQVRTLTDRGYRGIEKRCGVHVGLPVGKWKDQPTLDSELRAQNTVQAGLRAGTERAVAHLAKLKVREAQASLEPRVDGGISEMAAQDRQSAQRHQGSWGSSQPDPMDSPDHGIATVDTLNR